VSWELVYFIISSLMRSENARWRSALFCVTFTDSSFTSARSASIARCGLAASNVRCTNDGPRSIRLGRGIPAAA
jgi:hypothetical protein